ncbi:MAG: 16S rRNA (cytosine(1402)-N(4))-methyltransferase RsmH [Clostridia bacterium]|nr:16S rRNA (cytosine(1402)-N(4))-methyltransferase RsmH [Clostridia bacterium]
MEFKHTPIMLFECLDGLDIKPNGIYFDGTLGGAGHSSEILKRLETGRLIATDKDDEALAVATERLSKISKNFVAVKSDFKQFDKVLDDLGVEKIDGVLLDLGVSSYQLDNAQRGFSYIADAKLDMRMDKSSALTAEDVVNNYSAEALTKIFYEYGEETFTKEIVKNIVKFRETERITTTKQLADIIKMSVPKKVQIAKGNPCKKVFQAIRIEVNGELANLYDTICKMIDRLKVGGRIAIITFHSLEDRIVKDAFKFCATDCICPKNIPVCVCHHKAKVKIITKKPILPSDKEQKENSRSTSAKLRIAEKICE